MRHVRRYGMVLIGLLLLAIVGTGTFPAVAASGTKQITADLTRIHIFNALWEFDLSWDFGTRPEPQTVHVTWANGAVSDVAGSEYSGGYWRYETLEHVDSCVTSVTANVYADWTGEFFVASGPCTKTVIGENALSVRIATSTYPIVPDPGPGAYVRTVVTATRSDGSPAANANVHMSNARPGAVFHTNAAGQLSLIEPVDVTEALSPEVTATVTSTDGEVGSNTATLYRAELYGTCNFKGRPGIDTSLLKSMLPDPLGTISEIVSTIHLAASRITTSADGYKVTVPTSGTFYAQTLIITNGDKIEYSGAGYSYKQIMKPTEGFLKSLETSCYGPPA